MTSSDSERDETPKKQNISDYLSDRDSKETDTHKHDRRNKRKATAQPVTPAESGGKAGKKQFVLSDSESEDEDDGDTKKTVEFPFTVIPVQNQSLPGFVFYATGFADKYMAEIQYHRNMKGKKNYLKFIKHTECVQHVNTVLEQGSKTVTRKKDAQGQYAYKAWAKTYAPGTIVSKELVQDFFDTEFMPGFNMLTEGKLRENQIPGFSENYFEPHVTNWSDAVISNDLTFIFEDYKTRFVKDQTTRMGKWIALSKENLYAIYTPGELPRTVYKAYNIPDKLLDPNDLNFFTKKPKAT